jgi:hypothetical protein
MAAAKRIHREMFVALVMAMFVVAGMSRSAFAQPLPGGQVEWTNYFTNADTNAGSAAVHITDPLGYNSSPYAPPEICAEIYVFDVSQGLQECCGCPVSTNGLLTLNITSDLASSAVAFPDSGILTDGVIRIVSEDGDYEAVSGAVKDLTGVGTGGEEGIYGYDPQLAQTNPGVPVYYGITPPAPNNGGCTGAGAPYACCAGPGTGNCLEPNAPCTGLNAPYTCCTGAGTGTCYQSNGIGCDPATGFCCDPEEGADDSRLQPTLRSWITHPLNAGTTEDRFEDITSIETSYDADNLAELCDDVLELGSGIGPCACGTGS